MPEPMTLEGPRLRLRPWREGDLAPLAAINADPVAMRYFAAPLTRAESDAWAGGQQEHIDAHGWGFWAVERRDAPGCIGAVGLKHVPWKAAFTPAVEIGWRIAPACQGQGYAEEAARLSLDAGFGPVGLSGIVAFTVPANEASRRLMEKLGMSAAGTFEHPRLPEGHHLRPHLLYRLTREAWTRGARRAGGHRPA